MKPKICLLDTCLLFGTPARNYVLALAKHGIIEVRWSPRILEEWRRSVRAKERERVNKLIHGMNLAFPQALIKDYEHLIPEIKLYDKDDRHVVAAAAQAKADFILTFNKKDFPYGKLAPFGVEAEEADIFVVQLIRQHSEIALKALEGLTVEGIKKSRLIRTAGFLERIIS